LAHLLSLELGSVPWEKARFPVKENIMTDEKKTEKVPLLLWPFYAIWRLVALILEITGRVLGVILGLVLLTVGLLVSLTVIGAVIGIPLMILGMLLMLRGLF